MMNLRKKERKKEKKERKKRKKERKKKEGKIVRMCDKLLDIKNLSEININIDR